MRTEKIEALEQVAHELIKQIGEDPARQGLLKTPFRYAKALEELTSGYAQTLSEVVGDAVFDEAVSQMILVRDIEFYSLCEHHILPFFGRVHVAYIPNGRIIGLSKVPRIVGMYARRLQVQERLTDQIADALEEVLNPRGVACTLEASHMCTMMRGVQAQASTMVTSTMRGVFKDSPAVREEFFGTVRA